MSLQLLAHAAATWFMVGLIWTIQLVHYPLFSNAAAGFAEVAEGPWRRYHDEHARRITWIVGPVMSAELFLALGLIARPVPGVPESWAWAGLALLAVAWGTTALCSVPAHGRLGRAFSPRALTFLVATNWLRTAAWTLRGLLALAMLRGA